MHRLVCNGSNCNHATQPPQYPPNDTTDLYITATGKQRHVCPKSAECHVYCGSVADCDALEIYGPHGYILNLTCPHGTIVEGGIIHAENASSFLVRGCRFDSAAGYGSQIIETELYLSRSTIFSGISIDSSRGMTFYAINGFKDININAVICRKACDMYCGSNYQHHCQSLSGVAEPTKCNNASHICNGLLVNLFSSPSYPIEYY